MVPFDVVLLVCHVLTGNCHEVAIGKWGERMPTPWECARYGQVEAVKWMETHPNYKLAKFGCARKREAA